MQTQTVPDKRGRIRFTRECCRFVVTNQSVKVFFRTHFNGKNYEEACQSLPSEILNDEELLEAILDAKAAIRGHY